MLLSRYVTRCGAVRYLLLLIVSALFCGPAPAAEIPPFPLESYRLPNGLKVALSHDPAAPRTTVCVAYHVGSKNERAGLTGFAHFFEHMMFRGTENVPNFDTPLQEAGGSPNAFTSQDVTVYFQTVPNHYVHRVIYMEAERMAFLAGALDQEKFDTEREVVKNERRQTMENVPYGLADETLASQVYPPGHPYSWSVIGSMRDLDNATLDDLRDFFHEFYHPANATLTILGGFDPAETKAWIEDYFGPLAAGQALAPLHVPPVAPRAQRIIQQDRVQFPRVYWAWPTVPGTHPDAPALGLLAMLLSSGDASRLQQALVIQSQSAVQADASSATSEMGGMFEISVIVAPQSTVEEVEHQIGEQLARLQSVAPSEDELDRIKRKYRTQSLIGLTAPMRRAIVIALGLAQHDDPEHFRAEFARHDAVTTADLQRVAREYLVADKTVLVVEPVGPGESPSEAVLVGPLPGTPREPVAARPLPAGPDWTRMPDPTTPTAFAPPAVSRRRLSNGLDVWIAPWNTLPLVSARLIVRAGSADDPPGQSGLAALTAQLWDQGTARLTATELAEEIDALGTSFQIGADTDITQLGFTVERSVLPQSLTVLGELMTQPRFDPGDFEREQRLLLSALASGRTTRPGSLSGSFRCSSTDRTIPSRLPPKGSRARSSRSRSTTSAAFTIRSSRPATPC
jgi:zinc protease